MDRLCLNKKLSVKFIFWQEMKVIQGSDGLKRTKKRGSAAVGSKN